MTDPTQLIHDAKFFSDLSEAACKRLAEMSRRRTVEKRELLFMEGAEGKAVYLLTSGSIQLVKINLATLAVYTLSAGWLLNRILSSEMVVEHVEHHTVGAGPFEQICTLLLIGILIAAILPHRKNACCHHAH